MTRRYPFALIKERLAERGDQAIDFAMGRRSIPLPEDIASWVRSNWGLALQSASRADMEAFAEAAARYMAREYKIDVPSDHVLPTVGGRVAMTAFIACVLRPDDAVLVTEPGYPAFARLAQHRHARVITVPLDPDNAFAPRLSEAPAAAEFRVISVNYPNNPTGAKLSGAVIANLGELASSETVLFNDATYGSLVYDEVPTSLLGIGAFEARETEIVELHSFSKLFPLGPIALSFVVGSETTMREMKTYSEYAWSPLSRLQIQATIRCLDDAGRLQKLREFFPAQLERLSRTLTDLGFAPYPAPAGIYVLCRVPAMINGQAVASAEEAAGLLMEQFDIAVVPLDTAHQSYLRFSSLYEPEELKRLATLADQLELG